MAQFGWSLNLNPLTEKDNNVSKIEKIRNDTIYKQNLSRSRMRGEVSDAMKELFIRYCNVRKR